MSGGFGGGGRGSGRGRGSFGSRSSWGSRRPDRRTDGSDATGEDDPPPPPRGGTVSRITAQVRDPNRSSVFLDGEFGFGITTDRVLTEGLVPGDVLTAERVAALIAQDDADRAIAAGLNLLSYRPRTVKELEDRLARNGFAEPAVLAAIERLTGWGYLDDGAFARRWVENRIEHRPRGARLLAQELRQKGVDRDVIGETIDEAEIDELAAAIQAGERKAQSYAELDPAVARRRLTGFLARRGFTGGTVRQAVDQLLTPPDEDEDEDIPEDE
ncbi:MAG TPA: regulatory protein RecX [Thermomicrobiales bacterium]|jgi:regulatory protein|nr:regulatory protein RecX [Thermomicrobiales bacterium]